MKFSCNSAELQKSLGVVEKAISSRTTLPILENVYLELKDGVLIHRASDLEVSIEFKKQIESANENGKVLVKSSTLSSILSKLNNQSIDIEVDAEKRLRLKSGSVGFDLLGQDPEQYPSFPEIESGTSFTIKASELSEMIHLTIFAVSTDETKQFLNGTLLKINNGELDLIATDGFRLALKKTVLQTPVQPVKAIIPFKAMNELYKILQQSKTDDEVQVSISDNQASFRMSDFILISRVIQGQFPDYNQVIPKESRNEYVVPRRPLVSASDRSSIIASHTNNVVRFVFSDNNIEILARAPKTGEFKESLVVNRRKGESGETRVSFNIKLVLDAIKNMDTDEILVVFNDELSPCVIKSVADDSYVYIIMPIRTSDFEEPVRQEEPAVASV